MSRMSEIAALIESVCAERELPCEPTGEHVRTRSPCPGPTS